MRSPISPKSGGSARSTWRSRPRSASPRCAAGSGPRTPDNTPKRGASLFRAPRPTWHSRKCRDVNPHHGLVTGVPRHLPRQAAGKGSPRPFPAAPFRAAPLVPPRETITPGCGHTRCVQPSHPFLDHPRPLAFAHRGGALDGLENSMTAFQRAVDLGYRYLETDVHATADGVVLAFHDKTLDRVTDRRGRLAELPYREVANARIGGREPIPRLEDLLSAWPDVRINVDVKDMPAIGPLVKTIRRAKATGRLCVASFSEKRVAAVREELGPNLCTSLGTSGVLALRLASYGGWLVRLARRGIPCAQVPPAVRGYPVVTRRFVRTAHELGMQVHAWVVNDPAEISRLLDLGVDGIMTDRLEALRDLLVARGAWHGSHESPPPGGRT
ncbi:MAG: hypothetical protein GEV03_27970 [Streptosporangiales bacterium]|nr:hypothetical protein [Streptosporangiales bacterium]